ncbi:acetate--CoA ligase family protein [Desulfomicrobium sp. ZS1]|uniref:acetate--CoA ligase family protein n=1 Tax=Desulfomicrobium sp. ZS1 TaxID=2952228 RepID=UPI0020B269E4|nr:acetate--CoA ligase family protein [Desulfomicrobium sp. ZS1]UTF49710.1 acetate--CoA ligase family protein [Desulfomicrobium sp. ZS1]
MSISVATHINFTAMTQIFAEAQNTGRDLLYEHEVYSLLQNLGSETPPRSLLLQAGTRPTDGELHALPGDRVVLKIVSPYIVHKSDVGGVRIIPKHPDKIRSTWRRMMYEVAENYADRIERRPAHAPAHYQGLTGDALISAISQDIQGVLLVQFIPPDTTSFGNELLVGLRATREFGMILTAGVGGTDTELLADNFRKNRSIVSASTELNDGESFFELFRRTVAYKVLAGKTRGQKRVVADEQLIECFSAFIQVGNHFSPTAAQAPFVIEELEINPFAFSDFMMVPLDGMCRFSLPQKALVAPRPVERIHTLLHPGRIGLIGVSTSRQNFGRVILQNVLAHGFPAGKITVIHPTAPKIDGVACAKGLSALDEPLDLFVVAVAAEHLPELIEEIMRSKKARSVLLIPGGLGETQDSKAMAEKIMALINEGHRQGDGPVFLGGNSMGVISHPGNYDTWFIPEKKLPKGRGQHHRNSAFISQSGAFMATRMSRTPELDPAYLISIGNQNDLTLGDFMAYFKTHSDTDVVGVYCEGFNNLDGVHFTRAVRQAVLAGKEVIFYKAGRTPEGKTATSSHTASLAGDYTVCESCLTQAGAMVARSFNQFTELYMLAKGLHGKAIPGNRMAAVSTAGYEAVGMADNITADDFELRMATFRPATRQRIAKALEACGLERLVEVKNPLDMNPAATDGLFTEVVEALAADPGVDLAVIGMIPLTPSLSSLDMDASQNIAERIGAIARHSPKPIVAVVDGGEMYNPFAAMLRERGMPVFRDADRAVRALGLYVQARLGAENLRCRRGGNVEEKKANPLRCGADS